MNKKEFRWFLVCVFLILGFTIGGIVVGAGSSPQESISLDQHDQSKEKQEPYYEYIENKIMTEIKNMDLVVDCEMAENYKGSCH